MATQKKIYYLPTYGQLGNQLGVLAHLVAFGAEHGYVVVYPKIDFVVKFLNRDILNSRQVYFSKVLANGFVSFCINKMARLMAVNKNRKIFNTLLLNQKFNAGSDFNSTQAPPYIIITDWLFRDYESVKKHQQYIRQQLSFHTEAQQNAGKVISSIQKEWPTHTLVGVHVRRGDYATWLYGKYFYDDAAYYKIITDIASQLTNCVFVICSNEELKFDNAQNLPIVYSKGTAAEDIILLSQCSYITGPPSTFSSWAAFLGNQKLLFLETKDEDVSLNRFQHYYL